MASDVREVLEKLNELLGDADDRIQSIWQTAYDEMDEAITEIRDAYSEAADFRSDLSDEGKSALDDIEGSICEFDDNLNSTEFGDYLFTSCEFDIDDMLPKWKALKLSWQSDDYDIDYNKMEGIVKMALFRVAPEVLVLTEELED